MRKTACMFFLFFIVNECFSQYTVTKVIGHVKKLSGEVLITGSALSDNDVLLFSTPTDMVRAIVAGKGVYVLTPSPKAEKQPNAVVEILKYTLHLNPKEGYLSGRGEHMEMVPEAFETNAGVNSKNLFTGENKYLFDQHKYDVSGGNRFFLQVEYAGSKPAIHLLKTNADTLLLDAADFKPGDGDTVQKAVYKICFFTRQNNRSELLADVDPYFDTSGEMETIVRIMISAFAQKDKLALEQACYAEVYAALGKPPDINFSRTFEKVIAGSSQKFK